MTFVETLNNQFTLGQMGELLLRIIVACICGAAIGFERTKRLKEAGLRTHIIVCCASALMMIVSKYGFADLSFAGTPLLGTDGVDPARIAAQVISGISFLGAGIIFHNNNSIRGLTTAAGIWATAGIGIAIGAGMYTIGIFVTAIIALIQVLMHKFTLGGDLTTNQLRFTVVNTPTMREAVTRYMDSLQAQVIESKIKFDEDGLAVYNMTIRTNKTITIDDLSDVLDDAGEVKSVSIVVLNS